jgi:predicted amidohydrolase YtcJ
LQQATIFRAKEIITLDPDRPTATAVAALGDRILAVGSVEGLKTAVGVQPYVIDDTLADKTIVPGFVAQRDQGADRGRPTCRDARKAR